MGQSTTDNNANFPWNKGGIRGLTLNLGGKCHWKKVPILTHEYQYDLIFIQEHRMNLSELEDVNLSGYRKLQSDAKKIHINKITGEQCHETDDGAIEHNIHGLLIFISRKIKFKAAQPLIHPKSVESRSIMISSHNSRSGNPLVFHCVYQSHRARRGHLDITQLEDRPGTHYLLGDLNALHPDWCPPLISNRNVGSSSSSDTSEPDDEEKLPPLPEVIKRRINSRGRGLKAQLDDSTYTHVNGISHGSTTIFGTSPDLVITTEAQALKTNVKILETSGDVHYAINFFINSPLSLTKENFCPSFKFSEANWELFQEELDKIIESKYEEPTNLDDGLEFIKSAFQTAMEKSIPQTKFSPKPYRCWFWNADCSKAMNKSRKLKNAVRNQRKRGIYSPNLIREKKLAEEEEAEILEKARCEAWNKKLQSLVLDKNVSGLRKTMLTIFNDGVPPLGPCIEDPQKKATELAHQFSGRCQNRIIPDSIRNPLNLLSPSRWKVIDENEAIETPSDAPFTETEIEEAVKCNKKSAPGSDKISYTVTSHSTPLMKTVLLNYFNLSFEERKLPDEWKLADMLGIPKPLDKGAFRPITLLSVLCKLMEKMIEKRMCMVRSPFSKNTFGFQSDLGTTDALVCFVAQSSVLLKRCCCHVAKNPKLEIPSPEHKHVNQAARASIFVKFDFSKAFELARPEVICFNLVRKGVKGKILSWIKNYVLERKGRVKFEGYLSDYVPFENGTPQGSIISPNCFNGIVENTIISPEYSQSASLGGYADDVKLQIKKPVILKTITSRSKLNTIEDTQLAINVFTKCSRDQGLILNVPKTYADYFGSEIPPENLPSFTSNGEHIPWAKDIEEKRYLGVFFDRLLTFSDHADQVQKKVAHDIGLLKMMAGASDGTSTLTMLKFYITCIRPKIEFGIVCMLGMDETALRKLEVLQNNCLRMILGVRRDVPAPILHAETGCLPIRERRDLLTLRFFGKLRMFHNEHPLLDILDGSNYTQDANLYPDTNYCKQLAKLCRGFSAFIEDTPLEEFDGDPFMHIPSYTPRRSVTPPWVVEESVLVEVIPNPKGKNLLSADEKRALAEKYEKLISDFLVPPDSLAVFTDGSITEDRKAGFGIFITDGNLTQEERCGRLASNCGTVTVELKAIQKALLLINDLRFKPYRNIMLLSDSQGALSQIRQSDPDENLAINYSIKDSLSQLRDAGVAVTFKYVPSHVGIMGNEKADMLAKHGTELDEATDNADLTFSFYKNQCSSYIKHMYDLFTVNLGGDSESVKRYLHVNPNLDSPTLNNGTRSEQILLNNLRTHPLNVCTHHCSDPPLCSRCREPFSTTHYLFECPALDKLSSFCKNMLDPDQLQCLDSDAVSAALRGAAGNATQFGILVNGKPPRATCKKGHGIMIFHGRMRPY